MVILCGSTLTPPGGKLQKTVDGIEVNWGVNYLANFHLLSILSPAIRAQPPDRDVRIIIPTCSSYINAELDLDDTLFKKRPFHPRKAYGASKLALMVFGKSFQKHLDAYDRPDKQPMNARVVFVDPGWSRTPGMRRWLTAGSLWGLLVYLVMWPIWWLVLKSPQQGAQTFLRAAMEAELGRGVGARLLKECREIDFLRQEVRDDEVGKKLWNISEQQIEALEKEGAIQRAKAQQEGEKTEKSTEGGAKSKEDASSGTTTGASKKLPSSRRSRKEA
jgi:NAD(P)-dependent dehydrogenase (short-subunit alcohol dehydrogenase family)